MVFEPLETKKDTFTIGFISSLIEPKGWRVFLNAIKLLKDQNGDTFKAIMVGEGSDRDKVQGCIQKHKLPVELLQNRDQKSLADIYNRFHVFVFPVFHVFSRRCFFWCPDLTFFDFGRSWGPPKSTLSLQKR